MLKWNRDLSPNHLFCTAVFLTCATWLLCEGGGGGHSWVVHADAGTVATEKIASVATPVDRRSDGKARTSSLSVCQQTGISTFWKKKKQRKNQKSETLRLSFSLHGANIRFHFCLDWSTKFFIVCWRYKQVLTTGGKVWTWSRFAADRAFLACDTGALRHAAVAVLRAWTAGSRAIAPRRPIGHNAGCGKVQQGKRKRQSSFKSTFFIGTESPQRKHSLLD